MEIRSSNPAFRNGVLGRSGTREAGDGVAPGQPQVDLVEQRGRGQRVASRNALPFAPRLREASAEFFHTTTKHAESHVAVGIEAVLGEVIAQQVIVHRVIERNGELHAFPGLRIAAVLVRHGKADRLAVDVLDRRHRKRNRG